MKFGIRIYFVSLQFIRGVSTGTLLVNYSDPTVGERAVEPIESIEPKPGVEFVVEPEANQGKQLSIISCTYLI